MLVVIALLLVSAPFSFALVQSYFLVRVITKLLILRGYFDHRELVYIICEIQNHLMLSTESTQLHQKMRLMDNFVSCSIGLAGKVWKKAIHQLKPVMVLLFFYKYESAFMFSS